MSIAVSVLKAPAAFGGNRLTVYGASRSVTAASADGSRDDSDFWKSIQHTTTTTENNEGSHHHLFTRLRTGIPDSPSDWNPFQRLLAHVLVFGNVSAVAADFVAGPSEVPHAAHAIVVARHILKLHNNEVEEEDALTLGAADQIVSTLEQTFERNGLTGLDVRAALARLIARALPFLPPHLDESFAATLVLGTEFDRRHLRAGHRTADDPGGRRLIPAFYSIYTLVYPLVNVVSTLPVLVEYVNKRSSLSCDPEEETPEDVMVVSLFDIRVFLKMLSSLGFDTIEDMQFTHEIRKSF